MNRNRLELSDGKRCYWLDPQQAIQLELKLNTSEFGHRWSSVGNILFDFGSQQQHHRMLDVSAEQFSFLEDLCKRFKILNSLLG